MAIELELLGVKVKMPSSAPVLVLRERVGSRRLLPIYIGGPEAHSIDFALSGTKISRPLTHDLLLNVISDLGFRLQQVEVTELREGTFYADLVVVKETGEVTRISARPSDAIAVACRLQCPIFVDEAVLDEAGLIEEEPGEGTDEEDMVQELRKFLDEVNPEDFLPD